MEHNPQHLTGLTFHEARSRILNTLNQVSNELAQNLHQQHGSFPACQALCNLFKCSINHEKDDYANHIIRQVYLILSVTAIIFGFYVTSYEVEQAPYASSGLLLALIAMAIIGLTNALIIVFYKKSFDVEIYKTLQRITNQYAYYMKKQEQTNSNTANANHSPTPAVATPSSASAKSGYKRNNMEDSSPPVCIPTGHSQISIINTLRNGQWQKLPILMLAEGDIISLMGGDITPCKVVELIIKKPVNKHSSSQQSLGSTSAGGGTAPLESDWKEGEVIDKGCKIHISSNNSNLTSEHRGHSHSHHHNDPSYSYKRQSEHDDSSSMDKMLKNGSKSSSSGKIPNVIEKPRAVDPDSISVLRWCGNTRCFRVLETPMKEFISITYQEQNAISMNRGGLFLHKLKREVQMETFRYAGILIAILICVCIIRICVAPHMQSKYTIDLFVPLATTIILLLPLSSPAFSVMVEAFGTAEVLTTLEVAHEPENPSTGTPSSNQLSTDSTKQASPQGHNSSHSSTVNPIGTQHQSGISAAPSPNGGHDETIRNEFEDEEFIDEDLDARVEDIAEETATKVMYFRFFRYVLKVLHCRLFGGWSLDVQPIQEDSTKEERPLLPIPLTRTNIVGQLGAITMVCFVDDDVISENYSVTEEIFLLNENQEHSMDDTSNKFGSSASSSMRPLSHEQSNKHDPHSKVTVLDLHANPEATGSRFENPNWWKFLPCLKPLGFNALLTYKFTADHSNRVLTPSNLLALQENQSSKASNTQLEDKHEIKSSADVEKSLVQHIRKTLPLEFLRELAEEIGFVEDDLKTFTRALEVNVLAPGLENAHLLEDNHQWGQEESRRRGSLLPQLRGAIYRDMKGKYKCLVFFSFVLINFH